MEGFKTVTPKEMSFTWKEWVWGIWAYLRFWNKKFRSPYIGMQYRQALILMRLRGEHPMTLEEVIEEYGDPIKAPYELFQTPPHEHVPREYVPYVRVGDFGEDGLKLTWGQDKDES